MSKQTIHHNLHCNNLVAVFRVKSLVGFLHTFDHGLFSFSHPDTRIVELLVGVSGIGRGTDLLLKIVFVLDVVVADTVPEGPLGIGIDVHLDNTSSYGDVDFFGERTTTSVEDEHDGLVFLELELFLDVLLGVVKDFGVELDITGGVDTVDVTEGGSDGEARRDLAESGVDLEDFFGLRVETRVFNTRVINTIFFTTGDTDFHFKKDTASVTAFEILGGQFQVVVEVFGGKIDHVGRVKSSASFLEVLLISFKTTIQPRKELLGAVVSVENDGNTVSFSNSMDILGTSDRTENGVALGLIGLDALTTDEGSTTVRELDDDGAVDSSSSFETSINGIGVGTVDGGDSKTFLLSILEELHGFVTIENTRTEERKSTYKPLDSVINVEVMRIRREIHLPDIMKIKIKRF